MSKKTYSRKTYEEAKVWFRNHGFELLDGASVGHTIVRKNGVQAEIEANVKGCARLVSAPGILFGGEVSKLVDHGFQKHLVTSKTQRAATADDLKAIHRFAEEMKEAMGEPSLYNESLGSVSESYQYDRVKDRDLAAADRPVRAWQAVQ